VKLDGGMSTMSITSPQRVVLMPFDFDNGMSETLGLPNFSQAIFTAIRNPYINQFKSNFFTDTDSC